jgi:hypothetical protein
MWRSSEAWLPSGYQSAQSRMNTGLGEYVLTPCSGLGSGERMAANVSEGRVQPVQPF